MIDTKKLAILVGLMFLITPLAGCVGGGGESGTSGGVDSDDATNTTNNLTGVSQADLRPHVHNRWIDPTTGTSLDQIDLVNRDIEVSAQNRSRSVPINFCQDGAPSSQGGQQGGVCIGKKVFFPDKWSNGEQKIVPPGTSHLEITLDFDTSDFAEVAFYYQARGDTTWEQLTNSSNGNFAPGDTLSLPVSVKQSDDGHAHVSSWKFMVAARENPIAPQAGTSGTFDYGEGTITTKITAFRVDGELPLEPPHPLFWGNDDPPTSVYKIGNLDAEDSFTQVARLTLEPEDQYWSNQGQGTRGKGILWQIPTGFEARRMRDQGTYPSKLSGQYTMSIVPPKSRLLVANVQVDGSVDAGSAPIVCVFGQDIPGKGFNGVKPLGEGCQTFQAGMEFTVSRQITNRDTDSFYTNTTEAISRSRWTFYVQIKAPSDGQGATSWTGSIQADFFVTDQTQFEMPDWALSGSSGGSGNATAV